MGLLDDPKPRYVPPRFVGKKYRAVGADFEVDRLSELNNHDRKEVTEDFADSPFADRKDE